VSGLGVFVTARVVEPGEDQSLDPEHLDRRWLALGRRSLPFGTSHRGLFAAGDVRAGSTKRVATAVGEGSAVIRSVHAYLSGTAIRPVILSRSARIARS
jgi:hypothetical protein